MKATHTPIRNFRCKDEVWQAAMERAEREGTNLSTVLNAFLVWYGKGKPRTPESTS